MSDEVLPASVLLLLDERARQVVEEGYDAEHDRRHTPDELAAAAGAYALPDHLRYPQVAITMDGYKAVPGDPGDPNMGAPFAWPWAEEFWKPTPDDRVRELVKAGALIIAELDRLILAQKEADDE